jgi:GrpB-like predicted nucleotidyltransferase (UPF0157 family)
MDTVRFKPSEEFKDKTDSLFVEQKKILEAKFPFADIQHIGGTSVSGLLTKGDLDINVRVSAEDFKAVSEELKNLYKINQPENWSNIYASFKDDSKELGVQVTVIGSGKDFFVVHRDELRKSPELVKRLNELKARFEGKDMSEYRTAKGQFLRKNIKYNYE